MKLKNNIIIRKEKKEEYRQVENLVRESFWNVYRPGCLEHYVLNQLRVNPDFAPEYKRKGYGKIMLDYSLEKAADMGCGAVCFEGNIKVILWMNPRWRNLTRLFRIRRN